MVPVLAQFLPLLSCYVKSGDAFEEPVGSGIWNYLASRAVPSGTRVIVQAVATDSLGGVGILSEWTTIP
jgi:hypothetical protein